MSMPKFPDEALNITRDDAVNMILASIAMEELSLSHILNAEGEKIQYVLGTLEGGSQPPEPPTVDQIMQVNNSVQKLLETTMYKTMFLKSKMSDALDSLQNQPPASAPSVAVFGEFASTLNDQAFNDGDIGNPVLMPLDLTLISNGLLDLAGGAVRVGYGGLYAISATVSLRDTGNITESVAIEVNGDTDYNSFRVSSGSSSYTTVVPLQTGDIVSLGLVSDGPIYTSNSPSQGAASYAYTLTMYKIADTPSPII